MIYLAISNSMSSATKNKTNRGRKTLQEAILPSIYYQNTFSTIRILSTCCSKMMKMIIQSQPVGRHETIIIGSLKYLFLDAPKQQQKQAQENTDANTPILATTFIQSLTHQYLLINLLDRLIIVIVLFCFCCRFFALHGALRMATKLISTYKAGKKFEFSMNFMLISFLHFFSPSFSLS